MLTLPYFKKQVKELNKYYKTKVITDITINDFDLKNISSSDLKNKIFGQKIISFNQNSYDLTIEISNRHFVAMQLHKNSEIKKGEFAQQTIVMRIDFEKAESLFFFETNRNTNIFYHYYKTPFKDNGMNIETLIFERFYEYISKHSSKNISELLLDGTISGLDDQLISEILFELRINLRKKSVYLTYYEIKEIYQTIFKKFEEYNNPINSQGDIRYRNFVYDRLDKPCFHCGQKIKKYSNLVYDLYYCLDCQRY